MIYFSQPSFFDMFGDGFLYDESEEDKLYRLLDECEEMCKQAGIVTGPVSSIVVNPQLNYAWGRCIRKHDFCYRDIFVIEINRKLLNRSVPEQSLRNTILHELCHTVEDGFGHKKGWRSAANRIETEFDIHLTVTNTADSLYVFDADPDSAPKYIFRCCGCGQVIKRNRQSKFVKHYQNYRCGCCGGQFEKISE